MTSRIHRGFHRIGVVLAVPLLLLAGWLTGHEAWRQWTSRDDYSAFERIPEPARTAPNPFDQFDPPGVKPGNVYAGLDRTSRAAPAYRADYTMASLALALALALYAAARAVGWVLAGFLGSGYGA